MRMAVNAVAAQPLRLEAVEQLVAGKPRNEETARRGRRTGHRGRRAAALQRLQDSADAQSGEARHPRGGHTDGHRLPNVGHQPLGPADPHAHLVGPAVGRRSSPGVVFLVAHCELHAAVGALASAPTAEVDALEAQLTGTCRAKIQRHSLHGPHVPLGHGGVDVRAALHGVPADRRREVRLGAVALDGRPGADRRRSSTTSSTPRSSWTSGRSGSARRTSRSSRPR